MNREDSIRLAQEADPGFETDTFHAESLVGIEAIERFAALVAAHEREACAKVCEDWDNYHPATNYGHCIANEIRSRT